MEKKHYLLVGLMIALLYLGVIWFILTMYSKINDLLRGAGIHGIWLVLSDVAITIGGLVIFVGTVLWFARSSDKKR